MMTLEPETLTPNMLVYSSRIVELTKGSQSYIAFSAKEFTKNKDSINIFVHDANNGETIQFTRNEPGKKSSQPVIASLLHPSGDADHLLFLKEGKIWVSPLHGGESYVLWEEVLPISSFKLYHDGFHNSHIAAEIEVYADLSPAQTVAKDKEIEESGTSATLYHNLMIRHWNAWGTYEKRNHIFLKSIQLSGDGKFQAVSGEALDTMFGMHTDCPGKGPGGSGDAYCVSPNGEWMVISCRNVDSESKQQPANFAWSTDVPIFITSLTDRPAPVDGKSSSLFWKKISTDEHVAYNTFPVFSPDSTKIAFLSMTRAQYESDRNRISIFDLETSTLSVLTEQLDVSFDSLEWNSSSSARELFATGQYRGSSRVFRLHLNDTFTAVTSIETLSGDESRSCVLHVPGKHGKDDSSAALFYLESTLTYPFELKKLNLGKSLSPNAAATFVPFEITDPVLGEKPLQVLDCPQRVQSICNVAPAFNNGDLVMPNVTQHYFAGAQNDPVQLWYLPPVLQGQATESIAEVVAADLAAQSVPLLVIIHGGPQSALQNNWNYRWNLSTFASQGYGVVAINFHGSTGFGEKFQDSIRHDWGGKPYEDILLGVDYVLQQYPYLDQKRIAALGGSFGGYMIHWINGHSDRFKCLVNHAGVFSLKTECLTTEELYFPEWEFGLPWETPENPDEDQYAKFSPDNFIQNWKTPTLVIHGGKDFRVPESEGIAAFTALQRKGIPSKFLYFPDECHWILKPANSIKWYGTIFDWLEQYLKK